MALFIKTAESGGNEGTTFFRMIKHGIIQGGDPMTKIRRRAGKYVTGGLNLLKAESNDDNQTRGAVSATQYSRGRPTVPARSSSLRCGIKPALDGRYTIFARVVEGILVAQKDLEAAVYDHARC